MSTYHKPWSSNPPHLVPQSSWGSNRRFVPLARRNLFSPDTSRATPRGFLASFAAAAEALRRRPLFRVPLGERPVYNPNLPEHASFRLSGERLIDFDDADVPYELSRGQVIPYFQDKEGKIYFSGVDAKYKEVAGFGGFIEGRTTPSGFRAGRQNRGRREPLGDGEDVVLGALREFNEESADIFASTFTPQSFFSSAWAVVGETLVIILRVNLEPTRVNELLEEAQKQPNHSQNVYRETSSIVFSSGYELDHLGPPPVVIGGFPIWPFYARLLGRLREWYNFDFA